MKKDNRLELRVETELKENLKKLVDEKRFKNLSTLVSMILKEYVKNPHSWNIETK